MRLIDADELKKELQKWIGREGLSSDGTLELAISRVMTAPTIDRWIPVTERLPEETGWYLCTLPMGFIDESLVDMCRFDTESGNFWSGGIEYNVVAWMELPKPYEKGAEE